MMVNHTLPERLRRIPSTIYNATHIHAIIGLEVRCREETVAIEWMRCPQRIYYGRFLHLSSITTSLVCMQCIAAEGVQTARYFYGR